VYIGDWQVFNLEGMYDPTSLPGFLDWLGFLLGAAGIITALVQLCRSKNALIAAKESLDATRQNLVQNRLGAAIPDLQEMISLLDRAVSQNDRNSTHFFLGETARRTSAVLTLAQIASYDEGGLVTRLEKFRDDFPEVIDMMNRDDTVNLHQSIGLSMVPLRELSGDLSAASITLQSSITAAPKKKRRFRR
jgi:hypothetical protein